MRENMEEEPEKKKEKQPDLFALARLNSALWTEADLEPEPNFACRIFVSGWFVCACARLAYILHSSAAAFDVLLCLRVCLCICAKELCSRGSNEALIQQHKFGGATKKIAQLIPVTLTTAQRRLCAFYSPRHLSSFRSYSCKDGAVITVETGQHFFFFFLKHSVNRKAG